MSAFHPLRISTLAVTTPRVRHLIASLMMILVIAGCAPQKPVATETVNVTACPGGFMERRGLTPWPTCVIPYSDAGKSCSDGGDCQGQCLLKYDGNVDAHPIGTAASGQCQPQEPAIGCYAQIRQGLVATGFLCTD